MKIKKALFIINPISGGKNKQFLPDLIKNILSGKIDYEILTWQSASQDIESIIYDKIKNFGFTHLVAAGGDGTINRMASCVKETGTTLGILPFGSGNGLARFLKIPMDTAKALEIIATGKDAVIDSGTINDKNFFCTSGIGFDAHIGTLFATAGKRGPFTYIQKIAGEFNSYKPEEYELTIDGNTLKREAFLITFANASQWGNEAQIAPKADIQDGVLNVTLLKSFKFFEAPFIASRLFLKNMHKSIHVETFSGKTILVKRLHEGPVHFDGDPGVMGKDINVMIQPSSLKVCVPANSKLK